MNTRTFGVLAACAAVVAVLLCALTVAMDAPTPVTVVMLAGALLLAAAAGGLVGAAVAALRRPTE